MCGEPKGGRVLAAEMWVRVASSRRSLARCWASGRRDSRVGLGVEVQTGEKLMRFEARISSRVAGGISVSAG